MFPFCSELSAEGFVQFLMLVSALGTSVLSFILPR